MKDLEQTLPVTQPAPRVLHLLKLARVTYPEPMRRRKGLFFVRRQIGIFCAVNIMARQNET